MNTKKFSFKTLALAAIACASLMVGAGSACAQTYGSQQLLSATAPAALTNNVLGVTTNSYTNVFIDITGRANVGISVAGNAMLASNVTTCTFVFKQSLDLTTNTTETAGTYAIPLVMQGTTFVCVTSNITVNAVGYLYLDSIRNPSGTAYTNLVVTYALKPNRSLY